MTGLRERRQGDRPPRPRSNALRTSYTRPRVTRPLYDRIVSALGWVAAFCLASGVFLSVTMLTRWLPPTEPVAVGLVTIERYSKLRDYVNVALFFAIVPALTVWLERVIARHASRRATMPERLLAIVPLMLAPFFYLTTGKVGWVLGIPLALAYAGPRALAFTRSRKWFRDFFRPELRPYHALLLAEAIAWLFYRYIVTARRIAHIPTLMLEVVFVALFIAIFWGAAILLSRLAQLNFGLDPQQTFARVTTAALPLVLLPFAAAIFVPMPQPRLFMMLTLLVIVAIAIALRNPMRGATARALAAWVIFPALIYLFSFVSTAQLSQWVDLFHRGEAIGPASDYLRGKVPFRDVFALHGMLEDGQLDAWLMRLFGRSLEVAVMRTVVVGAFLGVAIWYLGLAVFRSIPLALICVAVGSWTTAENNRTFFQVAAVALFWTALQGRNRTAAFFSGVVAGVALFFSYEIGLYTIVGAIGAAIVIAIIARRVPWDGLPPLHAAIAFVAGTLAGALPFTVYLAINGALDDFLVTSFVTIPRIIDAVWSLPFPDIVTTFRKNLNLHTLADFILWEKFHLIVSPLVIGIAAVYAIQRVILRKVELLDYALIVMTVFATVAQRTAFGRASFRHQYFAAFLIGPLIVLLVLLLVRRLSALWREGGQGTRAFIAALALTAIPTVAVLFWIPDLINSRIHDFIRYYGRVMRVDHDQHAQEVAWRIEDVSKEIRALTKPNEPIFDFSNQPAFYFFADRPNPTRYYQVPIFSPARMQAETIRALERSRTKVIIRRSPELFDQFDGVTNDLRAQAVSAYIDEMYSFHRTVRGVELWTRRPDVKVRPMDRYLAEIQLPEKEDLVAQATRRMLFPTVGSVHGVNNSYWQSDLTIHNPHVERIRLHLRLVTGERSVDRNITLAARQTLQWPDLVKTLFGMRDGGLGTLWIEHRDDGTPIAIVKTFDRVSGGRASIMEPLTMRDAASWGEKHSELAIIAIPPATLGRRVNVGMANVGTIPSTFRLTAWTRTGKQVGEAIESGAAEDSLWIVQDAESQLGVKLDETMTLRISMVAGTGVAYASVVDLEGNSHFISATPTEAQETKK